MSPIASYISGYRPAIVQQPGGADTSAVSKGLDRIVGTVADLAVEAEKQVGDAQRLGEFVDRKRAMEDGIRSLAVDLEKDPDHKTYFDRAKKGIDEIHKQTLAGVNDPALAAHLSQYAEGQRSAFLNGAQNEAMKKTMQYTAGVLTADIDSRVKRAADAPYVPPVVQSAVTPAVPGNIDLSGRPVVKNADGSLSTVRSASFNINGKEVLIPTVAADGSRLLSNKEALEQYRKTGQHLGVFNTPEEATQYAKDLHDQQAAMYAPEGMKAQLDGIDASIKGGVVAGVFTPVQALAQRSNAYSFVAQGMVQRGDATGAKAFLNDPRVKEAVDAQDHARLLAAIRPVEAQQEGLTTARALFDANPAAQMIDLDAAAYKALKDRPEAYAHAKTELVSLVTMRQAAVKADVDKTEADAYRAIVPVVLAGGVPSTATIAPETWAHLNEVAPEKAKALLGVLDASSESAEKKEATAAFNEVMSIVSGVEQRGKIAKRSDVPEALWNRLRKAAPDKADAVLDELRSEQEHAADRLRELANRPSDDQIKNWGALKLNPKGLAATNLDVLLVKGKINRSQYQDLITDQVQLRSPKAAEKETSILSDKAIIDGILLGAGVKEKDDPTKYMKFYDALEVRRKAFRTQYGKAPDAEQLKGMARDLLAKSVREEGIFWNSAVPLYSVNPNKIIVPDTERPKIEAAIRRAGQTVTEDLVRSLYAVKLGIPLEPAR